MKLQGVLVDGAGIDSKRKDWIEATRTINEELYKGTLNIRLMNSVKLDDLKPHRGTVFNDFYFRQGKINGYYVYVCYKYDVEDVATLFIVSEFRLRDVLKLKTKDKVEVEL